MTDEVRRINDRSAIHDLIVRLVHAQDAHDWATLATCNAADATYEQPGGRLIGAEAIVERARIALTPLDASHHFVGSILVTLDPDDTDSAATGGDGRPRLRPPRPSRTRRRAQPRRSP